MTLMKRLERLDSAVAGTAKPKPVEEMTDLELLEIILVGHLQTDPEHKALLPFLSDAAIVTLCAGLTTPTETECDAWIAAHRSEIDAWFDDAASRRNR